MVWELWLVLGQLGQLSEILCQDQQQQTTTRWWWGPVYNQLVEFLSSMLEALGSILSVEKQNKNI